MNIQKNIFFTAALYVLFAPSVNCGKCIIRANVVWKTHDLFIAHGY
jgi:hypothetical protein